MEKIFADTDIILDLVAKREPFYDYAATLFTWADQGKIKIFVSALTFANLNYIITRQLNHEQARKSLITFKSMVSILPLTEKIIELALVSKFKDFEDGLQYYTATENQVSKIVTRNLKDYKKSEIIVLTAEQYIKSL